MDIPDKGKGPLYQRVADDIVAQVAAGNWCVGGRLPSERELCERYQVSQITVRRALRELAHAGRVYSHHGLGWFVSANPAPAVFSREVALLLPDLDWLMVPLVRALNDALGPADVVLRLTFIGGNPEAEEQALRGPQPGARVPRWWSWPARKGNWFSAMPASWLRAIRQCFCSCATCPT